jgi:hypothetical protein
MDKSTKFDKRCPRQLSCAPTSYCPLAVQRLKAIRHAGRELSEEEEMGLQGCNYAINHQLANYCFFKFISDFSPDEKPLSDMEIAHFCGISVDSVKKIEKKAIAKMRETSDIKEVIDTANGEQIMDDKDLEPEWEIPR